jgi:CheY-like chemotaxis protein
VGGGLASSRLLIVEANLLAQSVMRALMQGKVDSLEMAASLETALSALTTNAPNLVLVEAGALGADLAAQVSALRKLVSIAEPAPVALLCSSPSPESIAALSQAGAAQVLAKPISGPTLLTHLETLATKVAGEPMAARRA